MHTEEMRVMMMRSALLLASMIATSLGTSAAAQSITDTALPVRGSALATVEIVQVAGFECPFSAQAQATVKEIARRYPTQVRHVFLHNPLSFHNQSMQAALASTVAQKEGKFWEFADTFFIEQEDLSTRHTRRIAQRHDISVEALNQGIKSPKASAFIEACKAVSEALKLRGTPNFFINGTLVRGAKPFSSFHTIIDIEIALAGKEPLDEAAADAYRQRRTKANNPNLYAYLYGGKVPPARLSGAPEDEADLGSEADDEPRFKALISESDAYLGDPTKALVTLVSFVGYQCQHSRKMMASLGAIKAAYGDEVALVIKHLPLSIHPLGREAAVNALCAQEQGKFWELNDALFSNNRLSAQAVEDKARSVGVDVLAMQACADAGEVRARIREDGILAQSVGARGTPATYINGRQIVGSLPEKSLKAMLDAELERSRAKVADGHAIADIYPALMAEAQVLESLEERSFNLDLKGAPLRGRADAPVNVTVFFDYQCPYSVKLEASLQQIYQRYAGKVSVSVKHFPLSFHKLAEPSARATHCAGEQGKFWPMHDTLSARSEPLSLEMIERIALTLGLEPKAFAACQNSPESAKAVAADIAQGKAIGLTGTPTILINGRRYDLSFGGQADDLSQTIDKLLSAKAKAP